MNRVAVPEAPTRGDIVRLADGTEIVVAAMVGFIWPRGEAKPTGFQVEDATGTKYEVVARIEGTERRSWSGERRSSK